jgi:transposase
MILSSSLVASRVVTSGTFPALYRKNNGFFVSLSTTRINLTDKHDGFAYIAVDHDRRHLEWTRFTKEALDDGIGIEERRKKTATQGFFILVSSEAIDTQDVLQLYYTRQAVEQIFDVDKNELNLLPLRVHNEETFRGHLMLVFLASIAHLLLVEKLQTSKYSAAQTLSIFRNLRNCPQITYPMHAGNIL